MVEVTSLDLVLMTSIRMVSRFSQYLVNSHKTSVPLCTSFPHSDVISSTLSMCPLSQNKKQHLETSAKADLVVNLALQGFPGTLRLVASPHALTNEGWE